MMIARVPATAERGPAGRTANLPRVQTSNAQLPGAVPDAAAFLRDAELAGLTCARVVELPPYHYGAIFETPVA